LTDVNTGTEPPFHLLLEQEEVAVAATALNLLIADEAHQPQIRNLARGAIVALRDAPAEGEVVSVELTPQQMKTVHTAAKILFDDLEREQEDERKVLRRILEKLPDEHTMRAIEID
jgi:hypothetical protein